MNVVEMNNRIGQIKEEQREIQNEMRKGFAAEQKNVKEANDHRTKQSTEVHKNRLAKLEKENNERLNKYDKDTKEAIDTKAKVFKNEVARQKEGFEKQRRMEMGRLQRDLRNVKDSYRRTLKERELNHKNVQERQEKRLTNHLDRSKKQFETDIDRISTQSKENMERAREGFNTEKYEVKQGNIERETNMAHDMRKRDIASRQKHNEQVDRMRNTYGREIQGLKDHHQAAREKSIRNNQAENATMLDNFAKRESNIGLVNRVEHERQKEMHKGHIEDQKKEFGKRMNAMNRKALAMAQASDVSLTERLRNERVRNSYESRLKNVKLDLEETIKESLRDKEKISQEYKDVIQNRNDYNSNKRAENEMRITKDANNRINNIRSERNKMEKYLTDEIEHQQHTYENRMATEQDFRKDLLTTQRKKFSEKVVDMSEKNRKSVNDLQRDFTHEKSGMIETHKKEMHERLRSNNENHTRRLEGIIDSYETRLFTKNQELLRLKALFETRVKDLEDKSVKDYQREKEMEMERQKANSRSAQRTLRDREKANSQTLVRAKRFFDRQMLELKTKNDAEMAKTIRNYESRIERMNLEHRKKMTNKLQVARDEYIKLVEQSDQKIDALRAQYETRFDKLKMAMEKMKDSRSV